MKKQFLDEMYDLRSRIVADIERLDKENHQPQAGCKHCEMTSGDVIMAELRTRRSQLSSLDDTIAGYLKYHGAVAGG